MIVICWRRWAIQVMSHKWMFVRVICVVVVTVSHPWRRTGPCQSDTLMDGLISRTGIAGVPRAVFIWKQGVGGGNCELRGADVLDPGW